MMNLDLSQVESLCARLYNSQVAHEREEAEKLLGPLGQSKDHLMTLRGILDNSRSPFAQLFASTSFRTLVSNYEFDSHMRLEMRNYILEYLITHVNGLQGFVVASLIQLICRLVKMGWFEEPQQREIVDNCQKLILQANSVEHYVLGIQILNGLILEMNTNHRGSRSSHRGCRKTSMAFRDAELLKIFKMSIDLLSRVKSLPSDQSSTLLEEALKLTVSCMTFDFIGSGHDETADEPLTIQIPTQWRSVIEDPSVIELSLQLISSDKVPVSRLAMEFLVHLASVRRSIFVSDDERRKFLTRLVETSMAILNHSVNLQDNQTFNNLCKFLGRLKANFNLQDLINVTTFAEWIDAVAAFTLKTLSQWQCTSGSIVHLLSLWSRLLTSLGYSKAAVANRSIESKIPDIIHSYISSRMECIIGARNGLIENPLEDEGRVQEQLESFQQLCRSNYTSAREILEQFATPLLQQMNQFSTQPTEATQFAIVEGKITWIVLIISFIIKGRPANSNDEIDGQDGDLASKVLVLSQLTQQGNHAQRNGEPTRQRLDLSILTFLDNFRLSFLSENRMPGSHLFVRMFETVGNSEDVEDKARLLELIISKVIWNLQFYSAVPNLIQATLKLFKEATGAFYSTKLLMKFDTVNKMLTGSSADFLFLNEPTNARNRTLFYCIISRLLFTDEDLAKFQAFVRPMHQVLEGIRQFTSVDSLRRNVPVNTVIGVFRDLRGIVEATSSVHTYGFLFNWLHSQYFPVILSCLQAWVDQPEVTIPILKFIAEFAYNKNNRISFVVTYGRHVLVLPNEGNPYRRRFKGMWITFLLFSRALIGNYANFGVFQLYGDPALSSSMETILKLMTALSTKEIIEHKKVTKAYYPLLDTLLTNHMDFIAKLDFQSFCTLISTVEAGLTSFDPNACSNCSSAIDHLASYYYNHIVSRSSFVMPDTETAEKLKQHFQMWPDLFPNLLKRLMDIALFEETSAMWSLSRPILALIVINEAWFVQVKEELVRRQPEDRQKMVIQSLAKLMDNVERNLDGKNRDNFTNNLSNVKNDFKGKKSRKKRDGDRGIQLRSRQWKTTMMTTVHK